MHQRGEVSVYEILAEFDERVEALASLALRLRCRIGLVPVHHIADRPTLVSAGGIGDLNPGNGQVAE